ncbi:acyl carrier protein [Streptomyces sp. NPDC000410]|uniref:acyl carrier protein n=1 Tax=Streptomyces sp. NPDC000410 TaxID=3154254 RepID=UPI003328F0DB
MDEKLKALINERFPDSTNALFSGSTFQESGIDSMGVVEFIILLERHFELPTMLNGNELGIGSTLDEARELLKSQGVG